METVREGSRARRKGWKGKSGIVQTEKIFPKILPLPQDIRSWNWVSRPQNHKKKKKKKNLLKECQG
jgi:hypothetical protein